MCSHDIDDRDLLTIRFECHGVFRMAVPIACQLVYSLCLVLDHLLSSEHGNITLKEY